MSENNENCYDNRNLRTDTDQQRWRTGRSAIAGKTGNSEVNMTERPEAVESGTVKLVGTDVEAIINKVNLLVNDRSAYERMALAHKPYRDGKAC